MARSRSSSAVLAHGSSWASLRRGWGTVRRLPAGQKAALAGLVILLLTMLPLGRSNPHALERATPPPPPRFGGGAWKPLSADAGLIFAERPAADFFSTYEAGARVTQGRSPYEAAEGVAPLKAPYNTTYRYLPLPAWTLGVGLAAFPPWMAIAGWLGVNLALVCGNFLLTLGRRPEALWPLAAVWFAWFPVAVEWHMGQYTLLLGTLVLWGLDGIVSGPRLIGASSWGAAIALKITPVLLAMPLWLGGRRKLAVVTVVAVAVISAAQFAVRPSDFERFRALNAGGRSIITLRQPYAGSQGLQEAILATVWAAQGRNFSSRLESGQQPPWNRDPALLLSAAANLAFVGVLGWATWLSRGREPSAAALGLFAIPWFVLYPDVWEHHYTLFQAIVAWWLSRGVLRPWQALVLWALAGLPSLWYLLGPLSRQGLSTVAHLAYFWQRPIAVVLGTAFAIRQLIQVQVRGGSSS